MSRLHIALIAAMGIAACGNAGATPASFRAKGVTIDDRVLAGGETAWLLPPTSRYEVEEVDDKYIVVVKYWNKYQEKMVTGSIVTLDANNQFQPDGMRWKFTLTADGYLTWEEVKK